MGESVRWCRALICGLAGLTTVGRYRPANLIVFVLDNATYNTTGTGEFATATAAGWRCLSRCTCALRERRASHRNNCKNRDGDQTSACSHSQ